MYPVLYPAMDLNHKISDLLDWSFYILWFITLCLAQTCQTYKKYSKPKTERFCAKAFKVEKSRRRRHKIYLLFLSTPAGTWSVRSLLTCVLAAWIME